jgi:hypothetical protein
MAFFWYMIAPILALAALGVLWMTGAALPQHATRGIACLIGAVFYGLYVVFAVKRGGLRMRN